MEFRSASKSSKGKFARLRAALDKDVYQKWDQEQKTLRNSLREYDDFPWNLEDKTLKYIGGVDLSFSKTDKDMAVSYLVVMTYPNLKVVYSDSEIVHLDAPYIPGFLAFREVPHLMKLFQKLKDTKPQFMPQVILVDGNGVLHQNGFGLASHLGVLADIPTIGCGKTVFYVDGISSSKVKQLCDDCLHKGGDFVKLEGDSKRVWGAALRSTDKSKDPVIVSVGHKISLDTALQVIKMCCRFRVPEPIRIADLKSREIAKDVTKKGITKTTKNDMIFMGEKGKIALDHNEEDDDPWTIVRK